MKKVILVIFCTTILMSGCSSNTADTVSNDVQQVNVSYDQMNNEGIGWGFVRKKGAPPEIPNSQKEVLRKYDCYYIDENAPKTLYLTFDEGYENGYTSKILDVLEQTSTPAAFFVTGPYLITTFTGNVNNFNVIYLLTAGNPTPVGSTAGRTDLLVTWLYKLTVDNQYYNLGAVIGILTFVVLAVVSLITYRNTGSYKNEEGFQ